MYDFNYHRPTSLDEAKKLLSDNEDAKAIAGGMTMLPFTWPLTVQVGDSVPVISVSPPVPATSGSR